MLGITTAAAGKQGSLLVKAGVGAHRMATSSCPGQCWGCSCWQACQHQMSVPSLCCCASAEHACWGSSGTLKSGGFALLSAAPLP
jgi:hypothetical protein